MNAKFGKAQIVFKTLSQHRCSTHCSYRHIIMEVRDIISIVCVRTKCVRDFCLHVLECEIWNFDCTSGVKQQTNRKDADRVSDQSQTVTII